MDQKYMRDCIKDEKEENLLPSQKMVHKMPVLMSLHREILRPRKSESSMKPRRRETSALKTRMAQEAAHRKRVDFSWIQEVVARRVTARANVLGSGRDM